MHIAILVAILLAGGTTIAAENANPGDTLYPVKVSVNEEVRGALTFSSEAKANWHARQVERRLEEASNLKVRGELTAEAQTRLESDIKAHVESFEAEVENLEAEGDTEAAAEANADLRVKLNAHPEVRGDLNITTSINL